MTDAQGTRGTTDKAGDGWCIGVMTQIQAGKLAEAGYQLAQLVDFALKTQHDEQFNREVRNCVLAFWQRCDGERQGTTGNEATSEQMVVFWKNIALGVQEEMVKRGDRIDELTQALAAGAARIAELTAPPLQATDPDAQGTRGNEATMWTDEAMHAAYKEAFDKDPDAHHWALLSWIRDDMQQALAAGAAEHAAALARIAKQDNLLTAYRQACEKWEEIFQEQEAKTSELATTIGERDKLIGHLSRQLAERSEWKVVPPGLHLIAENNDAELYVSLDGSALELRAADDEPHKRMAVQLDPNEYRLMRRVQREDE